jgi:hypothetical protein
MVPLFACPEAGRMLAIITARVATATSKIAIRLIIAPLKMPVHKPRVEN